MGSKYNPVGGACADTVAGGIIGSHVLVVVPNYNAQGSSVGPELLIGHPVPVDVGGGKDSHPRRVVAEGGGHIDRPCVI